jgi:hypothetical protein
VNREDWPPKFPERPLISRFTEESAVVHGLVDEDYRNWYHFDFEIPIPESRGGGKLVQRMSGRYDILIPYEDPARTAWDMMLGIVRQWYDAIDWDNEYPEKEMGV